MARNDEGQVMHTWAGLRNARPLTHRMTWLQPPLGENGSQGCRLGWGEGLRVRVACRQRPAKARTRPTASANSRQNMI